MAFFRWGAPQRSLTASASIVRDGPARQDQRGSAAQSRSPDAEWQADAWRAYHNCGEVRFSARYVAHGLSRVRFFVGRRTAPGEPPEPVPEDEIDKGDAKVVLETFRKLRGRDGTFASLVVDYGIQQFVAGESWLVGADRGQNTEDRRERWEFLSNTEHERLKRQRAAARAENAKAGPSDKADEPPDAVVVRCWTRDPEDRSRCDSSLRAVLDIVEALMTAQQMQTATDRSRLATAGLLLMPLEGDLAKTVREVNGENVTELNLVNDLVEAASAVMDDPSSPQAALPIVLEMKAEAITAAKHLRFDREIDKTITGRIEHLVKRLGQGLDIAPEKLTGLGSANHWSAWAIDEQVVQVHIAPMAWQLAEDLTAGFLYRALKAAGVQDPDEWAIGADVTSLVEAPSRADNAKWAFDNLLIDGETAVVALGFAATAMPDPEEINRQIAIRRTLNGGDPGKPVLDKDGNVIVPEEPAPAPPMLPGQPGAPPGPPDPAADPNADQPAPEGPPPEQPNAGDRPSPPARRRPAA